MRPESGISYDTRYHSIDNVRSAAMSIVMFGHALRPYLTEPRRFHDPAANIGFDVVAFILYSFAIQLFFVTAGFSAASLLERRGVRGLWRNRCNRILLPFLLAWVPLSPTTRAAYRFANEITQTLSIQAGLDRLLAWRWLRWNKLYHLWFLPALLIFVAALLLVTPFPAIVKYLLTLAVVIPVVFLTCEYGIRRRSLRRSAATGAG